MVEFTLAMRFVHVLGMALLLGGSAVLWGTLGDHGRLAWGFEIARRFEWLFWGIVSVLVVTGFGNVGALGQGLPGPDTAWGTTFAVKLLGIVGLLAGSLVRTLLIERCADLSEPAARCTALARVRHGYAATTWYLVGLLALAEILAHG